MTRKSHKNFANIDVSNYSVVDIRLKLRYENNDTNSWGGGGGVINRCDSITTHMNMILVDYSK